MNECLLFAAMVLWFYFLPDLNPGEVGSPAGTCNANHTISDSCHPWTEPSPLTFLTAVVVFLYNLSLQRNAESFRIIILPEIRIHSVLAAWHTCHFNFYATVPSKRVNHFCPRVVRRRPEHDTRTVDCTVITNKVRSIVPLPPVAVDCNSRAVEIDCAIEFPFSHFGRRAT